MVQKGTTRWAAIACLMPFALALICSSPSLAQSQENKRVVGDWQLYEEGYISEEGYDRKKPTGVPDSASTAALNGRTAEIRVSCWTYQVRFELHPDPAFDATFREGTFENIAFAKDDRVDVFRTIVLTRQVDGGYTFMPLYVSELMRGMTFKV